MENRGVLGINGNERVQERLLAYLRGGRIHPAVILAGAPTSGTFEAGKAVAKYFLCTQRPTTRAFCDECNACRRVEKEIHPDLLVFKQQEEETLKIEAIRQLCHDMSLSPVERGAKICLVEECHRMNAASANAFLKTLEEPGENRYFWLLTSQPASLLPTVVSRCIRFSFQPNEPDLLSSFDSTGAVEKLFTEFLSNRNRAPLLAGLSTKEAVQAFTSFLQAWLRNEIARRESQGKGDPETLRLLDIHQETLLLEGRLRSNANYGLMLESFLAASF